jgi:hypothetical protein
VLTQALVAEPAVEALREGVLAGLPRIDEAQLHVALRRPLVEHPAGQLGSIVQNDLDGDCSALANKAFENPHDPDAGQRGLHLDRPGFARERVEHAEYPQSSSVGSGIAHEIQAPALVGTGDHTPNLASLATHPLAFAPPQGQSFRLVEPIDPLVVHREARTASKHVQPPLTKPRSLAR